MAVSESRGNTSRSVESGSDSLMVSGNGEAEELRHLLRRAGRQLMQEFPFQTQTQFVQVPDLLHRQQLIPSFNSNSRVRVIMDRRNCF